MLSGGWLVLRKDNSPVRSLDQHCFPDYLQPVTWLLLYWCQSTTRVFFPSTHFCSFPPFFTVMLVLRHLLTAPLSIPYYYCFLLHHSFFCLLLGFLSFPSPCRQKPICVLCMPSCSWLCRPSSVFISLCKEVQDFAWRMMHRNELLCVVFRYVNLLCQKSCLAALISSSLHHLMVLLDIAILYYAARRASTAGVSKTGH